MLERFGARDATDLAALIARGEVTAEEALESSITAAEAINPQINAVVLPQIDTAARNLKAGLPRGPFRGCLS
ncbi:hypothetical protein ACFSHQ_19110 [Gemmobacter lanyuensis]